MPNPTANHKFVRCYLYYHKTVFSYKLQHSISLASSADLICWWSIRRTTWNAQQFLTKSHL